MTQEKIVAALREHAEWAAGNEWETPITLSDDLSAAADFIENQQRELEALRQANEGLRFNLDLWMDFKRKGVGADTGHPDPIGLKGALSECPVCGGPCNWEPETDGSTCRVCGYRSGEARKEASADE